MEIFTGLYQFKTWLKMMGILSVLFGWAAVSHSAGLSAVHHIQIELLPAEMKLIGRDDLRLKTNGIKVLEFSLSERISQLKVDVDQEPRNFSFSDGRLRLNLRPDEQTGELQVVIRYSA
ncbi:MAG: hypothetical protein HKO68_12855, partial [Desulfobacterales bacterium]|nr:hypothetical protein [Desulfobacterales bacterium]